MEMGFIIRACSMTDWCSGSKVRCQRQSCMCCVRGCSVASATRPHAENCTAGCRWVWYGVTPTGGCCCILTSRGKPRSMLSSTASPNSARHDAYGCGSARKACAFRCTPTALSISAGSPPLTQRSTRSSPTRSMPAFMCMAAPSRHAISMRAVESESASDNATASSGRDHHAGYIDWNTFEANQKRLAQNIRPRPHQSGGAVREGAALLQGLAACGHCGRRLAVHYSGRFSAPGYHCAGKNIVNGRGEYCLNIGGVQIDAAVAEAFLAALAPAGLKASLQAIEQFDADHETTLMQFRRDVERARYNAQRAERRYRAVDPENRLVARGLEAEWESALLELKTAESELSDREH